MNGWATTGETSEPSRPLCKNSPPRTARTSPACRCCSTPRRSKLANKYKPKTLLDYGCGRGDAYRSPTSCTTNSVSPAQRDAVRPGLPPRRHPAGRQVRHGDLQRRAGARAGMRWINSSSGCSGTVVWSSGRRSAAARPRRPSPMAPTCTWPFSPTTRWWERKFAAYSEATRASRVLVETP